MKLILAVSYDGFLATGPDDDMKWTGHTDKLIFKMLTLSGGPLLVGSRTAAAMPKRLPGRQLMTLSTNAQKGITLAEAAWAHRDAWLIGGGVVALEALKAGYVERAYICNSKTALVEGIPAAPVIALLGNTFQVCEIDDVTVHIFTGVGRGT